MTKLVIPSNSTTSRATPSPSRTPAAASPHVDPGSSIVAGGVRYHLVDIEFHHPAEHSIKGKLSDFEVDLIHRSDDCKLAYIAVLLNQDRGFPNATLATLWSHLPVKPGRHLEHITDMISAGGFPASRSRLLDHTGSQAHPAKVHWFIFEQDLQHEP